MKSKFIYLSPILFGLLSSVSGLSFEPIPLSKKISENATETDPILAELVSKIEKSIATDSKNSQQKISSTVSEWVEKNVQPHVRQYDTVFYPFGDSDIDYAFAFFPQAKRYIFTSAESFEKEITVESHSGLISLLSKISQSGYSVHKIAFTSTDKDCIKIECSKGTEQKEILYIHAKLDNGSLQENNLAKLVGQFEFVTFLKNSNYALHDRNFSQIRNFIQINSSAIVQDDSGIPFNAFRSGWICHFFGNYSAVGANAGCAHKKQNIKNLFKQKASIEMPFPIHGFNERSPNLLIAISEKKISEQMNKLRQQMTKKKCNCHKNHE